MGKPGPWHHPVVASSASQCHTLLETRVQVVLSLTLYSQHL